MENLQEFAKGQLKLGTESSSSFVKTIQTISAEAADYSKKTFEDGAAFFEKLRGAKSVESALQIQSEYAKGSYAAFIAQVTKLNELYSSLGKEAFKPFQTAIAKD